MNISELKKYFPEQIISSLLNQGISKLNPLQEMVFTNGIPSNNILVSAPTASGKTLIAEIICLNNIIKNQKKAVYIAPMRALVMEKYNDFKKNYPYIKSAVSIGDLDTNDAWLSSFDIIFVSTEKFDSLIRHNINWTDQIGCIVFDEIHLIDDLTRGPTLEILITKLKQQNLQIIGLSATIGNDKELSEWISAQIFESNYRPTKLKKGILSDSKIYYKPNSSKKL
ncbi:MAG: DEAD/DEAH box helicase, partial [Candidatus Marsarchaeota archaeon]|nr:DEAD/DEAH box helicase [Candidatus Marsarchaeota archaeon]